MRQHPARNTPTRLSDVLQLPEHLRGTFGAPFETTLYVDDLRGSVLDDPAGDPGHLALVEIARTLLFAYENSAAIDDPRLPTLGPLFDIVLDCFGPGEIEEIMSYVVHALGETSPIVAIITKTLSKAVGEMFVSYADKLRAEGRIEGRTRAMAEAVLRVLGHRAGAVPPAIRERVLATSDEGLLQQWFDSALAEGSVEEVFHRLEA